MHFVDTNILVYPHDTKEPAKQDRATALLEHLWQTGSGRISCQVLQEFYAVTTRKLNPGLPPATARGEVRELAVWNPLRPSMELFERAWRVEDRWGLSWWDALIVASALAQNCRTLLSEDLQDGLQIEDLRIVNPFAPTFDIRSFR